MSNKRARHYIKNPAFISRRNVRQRLDDNQNEMTYDERVNAILDEHPCKHNVRDNRCMNENNPFGFLYMFSEDCIDFNEKFYPIVYTEQDAKISKNCFQDKLTANFTAVINKKQLPPNRSYSTYRKLANRKNKELRDLQNGYKELYQKKVSIHTNITKSVNDIIAGYLVG